MSTATVAPTGGTHAIRNSAAPLKDELPCRSNVFDFFFPSTSLSGCPIAAAVKVSKPQDESLKCRQTPDRSPR